MTKKVFLAQFLAIVLVLNLLMPIPVSFAEDVTGKLQNLIVNVTQNGSSISDGGVLTNVDTVAASFSFDVPVEGDGIDPTLAIHKGDTAVFILTDDFSMVSSDPIELKQGGTKVATVSFSTDAVTKEVTATLTFDGEDEIFDGRSNTVSASFNASLTYISEGTKGDAGDHTVGILDKTFTVRVPQPEIIYTMTKSGVADLSNKRVEWTVNIGATQGGNPIDLDQYVFSDDLLNVGTYVANSFEVNDVPTPVTENGTTLSYVFPNPSTSPQKITFETTISDAQFYSTSQVTISNTAQLEDALTNKVKDASASVNFTPSWISKTGTSAGEGSSGTYNPTNRTITWTIIANQMDVALNGLIIKDVIPSGLTYKEATYQEWDTVGGAWDGVKKNPVYDNVTGEFLIGDVTTRVLLEIVTEVPDEAYTTGEKTYTNKASMTWTSYTGPVIQTGNVNVTIGYNAISKTGSVNAQTAVASWTVKVDTKNQTIADARVYDLLMYGDNGSVDLNTVTGIPAGVAVGDLVPRYNQKYITGTFAGAGLTFNLLAIEKDGKRVGDLLEITNLDFTAVNTMTFNALLTDPDTFASNASKTIYNTAALFSGTTRLNTATASPSDNSLLLSKELLNRQGAKDPLNTVNTAYTTDKALGFNYVDKTSVFRINVNPGQMDLSNMTDEEGTPLGKITVTDILPAGWSFVKLDGIEDYAIFEGNPSTSRRVTATDTTPDSVAGLNATISGNTATFVFDQLNKPYVILLRAKPDAATLSSYFGSNKTTQAINTVNMTSENAWSGISSQQVVEIKSLLIDKKAVDAVPNDGEVRWEVEYRPYDISQQANKITDKLGSGMDIRLDNQGKLDLTGSNITLNEMTLNEDGTYTQGASIALIQGTNVDYNSTTKELSFIIPQVDKGYFITYLTDVSGSAGSLSNHVYLYNTSTELENDTSSVSISTADGQATFKRSGYIEISKMDQASNPLSGAVFGVYTSDGSTLIRQGTTDANGLVRLFLIPKGDYIVKETTAPTGYILDPRAYTLTVKEEMGTIVSVLNQQTGANAYKMSLKNTLSATSGSLKISKFVAGNAGDKTKKFDFKVTFQGLTDEFAYSGNGIASGTIKSGDTIALAHGESITILGLPMNTPYTVEEDIASSSGYTVSKSGDTGTIEKEVTKDAIFTNSRYESSTPKPPVSNGTGQLSIKKVVENETNPTGTYDIKVTIGDIGDSYFYVGTGIENGIITSGQTIGLKANQSIKIVNLEKETPYVIEETTESSQGYKVTITNASGQIESDTESKVVVTNRKLDAEQGLLEIKKIVENRDTDQTFEFIITFDDMTQIFPYTGIGIPNGTIRSGNHIALGNEQGLIIEGLPDGMHYSVTELESQGEMEYSVINKDGDGQITGGKTSKVLIKNVFDLPRSTSTNDDNPSQMPPSPTPQQNDPTGLPRTSDDLTGMKALLVAFLFAIVGFGLSIKLNNIKKNEQY